MTIESAAGIAATLLRRARDEIFVDGSPYPIARGRHRTHDHAAPGLPPELIEALGSDDPKIRADANERLSQMAGAAVDEDADEIPIEGAPRALVPDGSYPAIFVRHDTKILYGAPRVFLWFRIISGEYDRTDIFGGFPVGRLVGVRNFTLRRSQRLHMALTRLSEPERRADRLSLKVLRGRALTIETKTVRMASDRKPLPASLRYSIVFDFRDG